MTRADNTWYNLRDIDQYLDGDDATAIRIGHDAQALNTFSPLWWVYAFTDLFFACDFCVPLSVVSALNGPWFL